MLYNSINNENISSKTIPNKEFKKTFDLTLSLEEQLEKNYSEIQLNLKQKLLQKVKNFSPKEFEELCTFFLSKLIYNKEDKITIQDISKCLGKTGDGGVDGVIVKKDKLKTTNIYIQAKCWKDTNIGRPELQRFVGALVGLKARDGVFITTSKFATTAYDYIKGQTGYDIALIDGVQLVEYMIEFEIGVQKITTYEIKAIDTEFFSRKNINYLI